VKNPIKKEHVTLIECFRIPKHRGLLIFSLATSLRQSQSLGVSHERFFMPPHGEASQSLSKVGVKIVIEEG